MKLLNHKYFDVIEVTEDNPETLIIEEPVLFRNIVDELNCQINNDDGDYVLSDNSSKILSLPKSMMLITDIYNLDIYTKQLKNKLTNIIVNNYSDVEGKEQLIEMLNEIGVKISSNLPYSVTYKSNIAFNDVIKFLDFSFDYSTLTFLESLTEIISTSFEILKYKVLVTVNLKDYLEKKELEEITKYFVYKKIPLLMIERHQHVELDDYNHTRIIDKDLCVI